ncbi:hypothetical protein C8R42DRAFT_640676 [Lentinula raphanica]|nr:hypothetical protein C8R42DRAFT_640676 [Lentinula raphanica]
MFAQWKAATTCQNSGSLSSDEEDEIRSRESQQGKMIELRNDLVFRIRKASSARGSLRSPLALSLTESQQGKMIELRNDLVFVQKRLFAALWPVGCWVLGFNLSQISQRYKRLCFVAHGDRTRDNTPKCSTRIRTKHPRIWQNPVYELYKRDPNLVWDVRVPVMDFCLEDSRWGTVWEGFRKFWQNLLGAVHEFVQNDPQNLLPGSYKTGQI